MWMDDDIAAELSLQGQESAMRAPARGFRGVGRDMEQDQSIGGAGGEIPSAAPQQEQTTKSKKKKSGGKCVGVKVDRLQRHEAKMAMKLEQKQIRDGDGACSLRIKPGAKISAKQWARLDDRLREKVVKADGIPPYKVEKKKKARQRKHARIKRQDPEEGTYVAGETVLEQTIFAEETTNTGNRLCMSIDR